MYTQVLNRRAQHTDNETQVLYRGLSQGTLHVHLLVNYSGSALVVHYRDYVGDGGSSLGTSIKSHLFPC